MKKQDQLAIDWMCETMFELAQKELCTANGKEYQWYQLKYHKCYKLRSMQAKVFETDNYFFLQSYGTIVAFIDKDSDICYDVLRFVYGYTTTSAKHISAFDHDYGKCKWGCKDRLTWREV